MRGYTGKNEVAPQNQTFRPAQLTAFWRKRPPGGRLRRFFYRKSMKRLTLSKLSTSERENSSEIFSDAHLYWHELARTSLCPVCGAEFMTRRFVGAWVVAAVTAFASFQGATQLHGSVDAAFVPLVFGVSRLVRRLNSRTEKFWCLVAGGSVNITGPFDAVNGVSRTTGWRTLTSTAF